MAWTSPRTWVVGETVTAALMNTHVRDNLNALMVVTTKGDLTVGTASVTLARLAVGSNGAVLVADSAATPGVRWSSTGKTASAGFAVNVQLDNTLTAAANNDALYQIYVAPVVAKGAFTGLSGAALFIEAATASGAGTLATFYGLYVVAQTIATANWSIYVAGGNNYFGTGLNFINDTANANMTTGLTINQGAAVNEALTLKQSGVAHGITAFTETDSYAIFYPGGGASGGLNIVAFTELTEGMVLEAAVTTVSTVKAITAQGAISLVGLLKSGTGTTTMSANSNVVIISDGTDAQFIFDADGESHENIGTAWINFDEHDDIALLNLLAAKVTHKDDPIRRNFGKWLRENRSILEELKLVTFNHKGGNFINRSRVQNLLIGAMRQVGAKLDAQAERLLQLEKKVLQLSA